MTRMSLLSSPLLLGFEEMERLIDRVGKGAAKAIPPTTSSASRPRSRPTAPPAPSNCCASRWRSPGFKRDQLEITVEDNQLSVRGRQEDDKSRQYIHRGIAARQFSRTFVLADGIEVKVCGVE